jgi:ribosome assembly protein YihI (activator of Der GTPase)
MEMYRLYIEARKLKYSEESPRVEPARRRKKTQDYMAKRSEDGSRTSREELAGNRGFEQEQDPMASFHKGPMPLRGVKGHTTTATVVRKSAQCKASA